MNKIALYVVAIGSSLAAICFFLILRHKNYDHRWMSLLSLKLYCAFFFSFIPVPYTYLFLTSVMISVFIAGSVSVRKQIT